MFFEHHINMISVRSSDTEA